ncbi:MAG: spermidine/putrescine ABC transporter substrate-binding protein [Candidatus Cloacimonadales bacterium]|jgi:spermidine/putrescine transport system substrate-binding protein|nr:spermidine/putrescine ABC transporter substrate-binding protein [Candidatus Cloacimonadota bacterium]MDD2650095.1 spermidine/putrescine ABC transporter substrate-binding protein [Candidatus Cloacimonadota bacterium]MDD3501960.1 spermidine/putrescine ABC transporter substrate-binding protein [Candidatus Cloacimonadota bacterium]MDX9977972.1 spermidine/putrescine ABC transporter substrate-binding protein [Candidatus Cloacimonadales bacterium]
MKYFKISLILTVMLLIVSCSGTKKQVLYVFNWTDYIAPELVQEFEKIYNCKVNYDTYNSNENMLTKMKTSNAAYDIIVPSGDHVTILKQEGMIEELDKSKLENYKNLSASLLKKSEQFDPDNLHAIPYFWGTCGFVYNKKYMSDEEMQDVSWNLLGEERFNGKRSVTMLDDAREVVGVALIVNGYDPNDFSDEAMEKANQTLLEWDKNISQYDSDSFKNEVQDGTIWFGQAYNGDALQVMEENENIGFALPKEGSTLWIDFLVIPKNAENKELAYKFIDFLLSAEVAKENALYVQYASPNDAAFELLPEDIRNNKSIYPDESYLDKCYLLLNAGVDVLKVDKIWQYIRNN